MKQVTVRYFASIREALNVGSERVATDAPTLAALRDELIARGGAHGEALARDKLVRLALDQAMADESAALHDGAEVALPLKEFELLHLLLANAGRVMSRDLLIDRVWGGDYVGDTKTLDVHVKRLRSKVEVDPANPTRITTIRGLGYKYERPRA